MEGIWSVTSLTRVLMIHSADVEEIFEPVIQDVENLIAQQALEVEKRWLAIKVTDLRLASTLLKASQAIVLVGGFGSSGYLFGRIKEAYPEIDVLQPPDA